MPNAVAGERPKAERITRVTLLALALCASGAAPAFAQRATTSEPRMFVSVNALYRTPARTLSDNVTFQTPFSAGREPGSADSKYRVPTSVMFDGEGIVRLWRGLGAGVALSAFSSRNDFNITAQMPHPFYFNHMRSIQGTVNSRHAETTVHLLAAYDIPLSARFSVVVSAGPTRFSVEQKLVNGVTAIEVYPFDTAQFGTADLQTFNASAWGFNAGADLSWMLARNFGVGGLVRFAQAAVKMAPAGRAPISMDVGGLNAGGGVRFSF